MSNITIELDITDVVKLISCCNQAIVDEEESLRYINHSLEHRKHIEGSIEKIWEIKRKLKSALNANYAKVVRDDDIGDPAL